MEQLLRWNPNDNQGVRLSIGSEYLRAGHRTKAGKVLREHADEYPPYRYELGLLHLQKQKWAEAATSLRRGFVDNPCIAEILCGNPDPMPLPIWEGSNWQGVETAKEYVRECRQELLWENDYNGRELILDRERAVCSGIESTMSREIIKTRTDRSGQPMAPWKNPRARKWPSVH